MPSRRHLLTGLAAAPAAVATRALAQEPTTTTDSVASIVTGNGPHRFDLQRSWGHPGDKAFGPTHGGVVVLGSGEILCSTDNPEVGIAVFTPEGEFVRHFGPAVTHSLDLREEDGIAVIYATDLGTASAFKMNLEGEKLLELRAPADDYDNPDEWKPTATAVAPDGTIFVADGYRSARIFKYDQEGNYLGSFGSKGQDREQFSTTHGLELDMRWGEPHLLVCDREKRRLLHLDLEGNLVNVYSEGLRRPCTTRINGDLTAVAELEGRVTILDKQGVPVAFLGDNPDQGHWANFRVAADNRDNLPQEYFTAPHGLSWDAQGNLFILEWNVNGRITRLAPLA